MRFPQGLPAVLILGVGLAVGWAKDPSDTTPPRKAGQTVDLTKIDRTLVKEPAYQTKEPKYCLLVFGPEAKFRVWLVLDGGTLYVDRNGNGDPTEVDEQVAGGRNGDFNVGDVVERPDGTRHSSLKVFSNPRHGEFLVTVLVAGKREQFCRFPVASKPDKAPIVHLNGLITLRLHAPHELLSGREKLLNATLGPSGQLRRGRDAYLSGALGTPGLGTFALYKPREVLLHPKLTVEVEFPAQGEGKRLLSVSGFLQPMDDAIGFEMEGVVRVSEKVKLGEVQLTVSIPGRKDVPGVPHTIPNVFIHD